MKWLSQKKSSEAGSTFQQLEVAGMVLRAGTEGITATEVSRHLSIEHSTAVLQLEHWCRAGKTSRTRDGNRSVYHLSDSAIAEIFQNWIQEQQ